VAKNISLAAAAEAAESENQPIYLVEIELDSGTDSYTNNNEDVVLYLFNLGFYFWTNPLDTYRRN
jgi:hypothetical protein